MPQGPSFSRKRPRIAFLCDAVFGPYQNRLASGAKRTALSLGADFVCFVGGFFTASDRVNDRYDASFVYDLARAPAVDGLVIVTTVLSNGVGVDYIHEFAERSGLPVVSIGWLPGFPYILPDNQIGLRAMLEHLVQDHHLQRFAFIRGSIGNPESLERESVFRAVLESHDLPVREELVLPGEFVDGSGVKAIRLLFDERRVSPKEVDTIVAANDQMAIGAIKELLARGFSIPGDIAVTGFDDDDDAASAQPPLTTVRQSIELLGQRAVELLLDRLQGRSTPESTRVGTTPVLRRSCGCASSNPSAVALAPERLSMPMPNALPILDSLRLSCRKTAVPLFGVGPLETDRGSDTLLDVFQHALNGQGLDLEPFTRVVSGTVMNGDDPLRWQDILQLIETELERRKFTHPELFERGRWFLLHAKLVVTETAARAQVSAQTHNARHFDDMKALGCALMSAANEDALTHILTKALPTFGIRHCCICLFEDTPPERSRARVLVADEPKQLPPNSSPTAIGVASSPTERFVNDPSHPFASEPHTAVVFSTEKLFPDEQHTDDAPTFLSVHPLIFARKPLGYAVFYQPWRTGHVWAPGNVADHLSNAVYVLKQAEDLRHARLTAESARITAEAASTAKSDFVARMSHEIRTPLTAVMGYLDLCLRRITEPNERRYLVQAQASSKVLLGVLNNILDFSKIEAQKIEIEHTYFDVDQVLDQVIATCATGAYAKNIELVLDVSEKVPKALLGDPLRLTQILVNLVGNAIKFTAQGEVVLSIDRVPDAGGVTALRFHVRDTGIGIAPENLVKLMIPFVQADNSTTRRYGGTGLGLAISQRLIHRMGGTLCVNSEVGQGTECSFNLEFPETVETICPDSSWQWPELRVLVVDDNQASLAAITRMLNQFGCTVRTVSDGEAAIELMLRLKQEQAPAHLLLIDQGLPSRTGADVLRQLVELDLVRDCRILLMAPLGELESSTTKLTADVLCGIISKPVRRFVLDAFIQRLFSHFECDSTPQSRSSRPPNTEAILAGKRVLVVQDDEINRMLAKELLTNAGVEVYAVESGIEAVERVTMLRFDAVLMDLNLPLMDGCEATRIIRQKPNGVNLPIIALTASASLKDRDRCFEVGMNDFLQTPIDSSELLAALARWIQPHGGESPRTRMTSNYSLLPTVRTLPGIADTPETASDWLDVSGAIRRLGGDTTLYRRLLRRFLTSHYTTTQQLRDRCNPEACSRNVHTLNSTAANIGALHLQRIAQALELELRAGNAGNETTWIRLENALVKTLEYVATASGHSTNPPSGSADRERLHEELTTLATLLDRFDAGASDIVDTLPEIVGSSGINEEVRRIQREVRAYDFEAARQRVQSLLMTLQS